MFQNVYYSFFDWNGLTTPVFNGLANYVKMFTDRVIGRSMLNTAIWVVCTLALPVMGGLLVAVFITGVRGSLKASSSSRSPSRSSPRASSGRSCSARNWGCSTASSPCLSCR
jgi:ABC-type sugar transport system permease subunit